MNETIEKIMSAVNRALRGYGGDDRYLICEELSRLLHEEGCRVLLQEYLGTENDDD